MTCDDGISSPDLRAAVDAVCKLGDVLLSASLAEQSGSGQSTGTTNDCAIREIDCSVDSRRVLASAIHGSPAQAVLYALV